ncbi:VPLPA-CTERM-specific exosortase XrtD [Actibacterium sp. XHP0104]|uniref:VPLPA-CTERM-specific exosortase XrtD n=1 Tax=Actibacterium sp. XHP0104 TaxID=2984335 RepID=UPI0021E92A93|nr:VPLPA-CTERM-specific exosortase XrtD [Actibacterium sp. XHP0104]MCV2881856.1 VPLPA-CTERM-specific exosortase XrtD [Actibacterium sp. XHP0104]
MTDTSQVTKTDSLAKLGLTPGIFWLIVTLVAAGVFFQEGIFELFEAWQQPEYSHGPLIPVLSLLLFLRQLKTVPINYGDVPDRWPGIVLLVLALTLGFSGKMIEIDDIVAYALILSVGALLLISFGWRTGRHFWPPVVHLVYMLPLPGALYYGLSTYLQGVSSELGVYFLQLLHVPVFLEGNIIDLGVYKLQVAEACSGLRYLFPILSFSYIFAVLYQGPMWHKAILLVSAAPITVFMNSVRIALAGVIVNNYGLDHVEGFSHFFEGWVIFIACVLILFLLAWVLVLLRRDRVSLIEALDLETEGLATQAKRVFLIRASGALIAAAVLTAGLAAAWQFLPQRQALGVDRDPFVLFPTALGDWNVGQSIALEKDVARVLGADDYLATTLRQPGSDRSVDLFMAWYKNQDRGGVHSPEVCLPGAGWEIAKLEQIDAPRDLALRAGGDFTLNRAIIQKGVDRMLVYYWYEQQGVRTASMFSAKMHLMMGKVTNGRNDSAIVRLITPIDPDESLADAEARLIDSADGLITRLPRFVPGID